ncbi:uncharacterized protein BYT42DRAFT_411074 [Radiomyces spectabilis]|uniref:uncharacterized protein n=1 Tax=Radiomyces spectabilis TaxID=64574 RepID=UPI00221FCEFE|nr:uncharacterized protein BYT42DRAFT_411074 [Radiomyces spectabilis]KAI8374562.1 hypothetical protein BYT42DRAFT_411074 [Radiomyces spectabilis]
MYKSSLWRGLLDRFDLCILHSRDRAFILSSRREFKIFLRRNVFIRSRERRQPPPTKQVTTATTKQCFIYLDNHLKKKTIGPLILSFICLHIFSSFLCCTTIPFFNMMSHAICFSTFDRLRRNFFFPFFFFFFYQGLLSKTFRRHSHTVSSCDFIIFYFILPVFLEEVWPLL